MATVTYYLDHRLPVKKKLDKSAKKATAKKKDPSIIAEVSYSVKGRKVRFRFSTEIKCGEKNFIKQSIHGREPNAELKNASLLRIKEGAEKIYLKGLKDKSIPSPEDFKVRLKALATKVDEKRTIIGYFDDYIASITAKQKSKSFISAMGNLKDLLIELKSSDTPVTFGTINSTFETKFRQKLLDKEYKPNTVSAWIKRLKIFMNWAAKQNYHTNQLYKQFEMVEVLNQVIALTEIEVQKIATLNIPTFKHIEGGTPLIRDWFIVSTQTGLRYSDFKQFRDAELIPVKDGYDIFIKPKKTTKKNIEVVIPVSQLLYKVLKSYNFSMPLPPSNQKYNEGLKRIAIKAGIDKILSSHTGRKTFCTTMYKREVPVPNIMKISGHRTEKEFYKYIGVSGEENAAKVRSNNPDLVIEHEPKMAVNR